MKKCIIYLFMSFVTLSLFSQTLWNSPKTFFKSNETKMLSFISTINGGIVVYQELNEEMNYDLFIQKTDINGNFTLSNPISLFNDENHQKDANIVKTSDNNYMLSWVEIDNQNEAYIKLIKMDENGQFLWDETVSSGICPDYFKLKEIQLFPDNNGGAFVVWIEQNTATIQNLIYNRIDANGSLEFPTTGFVWFSNNNLSILKMQLLGNGLSLIAKSYSARLLVYLNSLVPDPVIILQNNDYIEEATYDFIQFNNQQSFLVIGTSYWSFLIIYDENFNQIYEYNLTGGFISLTKLNDNEILITTYDMPGRFKFCKYDINGDLVTYSEFMAPFDDYPVFNTNTTFYQDNVFLSDNQVYTSFYGNVINEEDTSSFQYYLMKYNLQNNHTELIQIATTDNNLVKSQSASNENEFMIYHYNHQSQENYYCYNRLNLESFNSVFSNPDHFLSSENDRIIDYKSAGVFSDNYFIITSEKGFRLQNCNTNGDNNEIFFDNLQISRIILNQTSNNNYLVSYLQTEPNIQSFNLYDQNNNFISSISDEINPSNMQVYTDVMPDYSWISYRSASNLYNKLHKIQSGSFPFGFSGHEILYNSVVLGMHQNYILFKKSGVIRISKLDETGSFSAGWTEEGIALVNGTSSNTIRNVQFQLNDQGIQVAWIEISGSTRKLVVHLLNPDNGEDISNGFITFNTSSIPEIILVNNHIFMIYNTNNILSVKRFDLINQQLVLSFDKEISSNVSSYDIKKENNRFIIAYSKQIDNIKKIYMKTLSFNGGGDQFADGWPLPSLYLHQDKPQIILTNNNQAFINRLEYNLQSDKAIVSDLIDLNDFVTTDDHNELDIKQTTLNIYPNPFNPTTTIKWIQTKSGQTSISIYNIKGQKIKEIYSSFCNKGEHQINWDARDLSSGIYFVKSISSSGTTVKKIVLIK